MLRKRRCQLTQLLLSYNPPLGTTIAVFLDRCLWQVVAPIAIWAAGCACLMLNPDDPPERLRRIIEDSKALCVLCDKNGEALLDKRFKKIYVDSCFDLTVQDTIVDIDDRIAGYYIFTSGSTGTPKGIVHPRRTLANLGAWASTQDLGNVLLQFSAANFDMFLLEVLYAWAHEAQIVIPLKNLLHNPVELAPFLDHHKVSGIMCSVSMLQACADVAIINPDSFLHLKSIATAGESLILTASIKAFFKARPNIRLFNYYGPSETHVVTAENVDIDDTTIAKPSIGTPLPGSKIYILNDKNQVLPYNVEGELCVSGAHVALGYLGNSKDSTRFEIFKTLQGCEERIYRTGDIAKWLPDGRLSFYGRKDQQVKVRGYRVELEEV